MVVPSDDLCFCWSYKCGPNGAPVSTRTRLRHEKRDREEEERRQRQLAASVLLQTAPLPTGPLEPTANASRTTSSINVAARLSSSPESTSIELSGNIDLFYSDSTGFEDDYEEQGFDFPPSSSSPSSPELLPLSSPELLPSSPEHLPWSPPPSSLLLRSLTPPESPEERQLSEAVQERSHERLTSIESPADILIPAFQQPAELRLAYLQVIAAHIVGNSTVVEATQQLKDRLDLLDVCGKLLVYPPPRRSITTVKKDLGLAVDDFVRRIPVCPSCFHHFSYDNINALPSPSCPTRYCKGQIYRVKRPRPDDDAPSDSVNEKHIPEKILLYCPLRPALQRFLLCPSFISNLRDTSSDEHRPPVNDETPMHDIYDGSKWSQQEIGLNRIFHADGSPEDVEERPGSRRSLFSCDIGLSLTINIDWFGITDSRPYSVGAVYLSFNNLHRAVRFLPHNVHLAMAIPGPTEPSLEALNPCLAPLKDKIRELYKGVYMRAHGFHRPQEVAVNILCECADIPATHYVQGTTRQTR
ncbi:hypothetical protein CONPUDRAFT_160647 [Coniophora puteana RWD-64-598 SS2]|uniref:Uncharacterized protein n=1 Tax=Coniophora puteana (strain RWD-64-598) TaxID=741705 RepID=R7SDK5_CONPW|nr:uncharacterized protein CONPUDRAFT_160647 [Coniophora puteana RWD-64-598 SS2]EIW73842.1 hypothetical protein CONPUDRAFT_160647 [Coniophora puteana RWD-64-598 SS2]